MTADPTAWFLTSQALDHHATVDALTYALPEEARDGFRDIEIPRRDLAEVQAAELARAGYALVQVERQAEGALAHDLTEAVEAHLADPSTTAGFLARKED
jgi:hypothetical protein